MAADDFAPGSQLPEGSQHVAVQTNDGSVAPGVLFQGQNGPRVATADRKNREYDSNIVDLLDVIGKHPSVDEASEFDKLAD